MSPHFVRYILAVGLLASTATSLAEDIDLFVGTSPVASTDAPNVVLVIDNAANFSANVTTQRCSITAEGVVKTDGTGGALTSLDKTAGAVEQCALYAAIQALNAPASAATVNIGVMGFNATGMKQFNPTTNTFTSSCTNGTGGCLLMPLTPLTTTNKTRILEWIRQWQISGSSDYVVKGNNTANGAAMQETWAYFFGKTGVSGRSYSSIAPPTTCGNNFTIFIGNAYRNNATPGDGTNEDNSPKKPLFGTSSVVDKRANPAATAEQQATITGTIATSCGTSDLQTAEGKGIYALNWARYMKAQDITTYSIGVLGPTCNAEYAAHLTKLGASDVGGGKYFATNNFEELKLAIGTALSEIQSVNSVFASVSLPVSVNTQGTYLNQVYIGMFRPDGKALPRWSGNLKQYKMGRVNGVLKLLDADETSAISSSGSGFIAECARSFWTPDTGDTYWTNLKTANCVGYAASSNFPDGNVVEKGAQGYKLRGVTPSDRTVKTCSPVFASCPDLTGLTDFVTSNTDITQTLLNSAVGANDRNNLINWARGLNNKTLADTTVTPNDVADTADNFNLTTAPATAMRPSSHGDVAHSRPVAINFGTDASPQVVVFYGGNDGALRAVNGNRSTAIGSVAAGDELWSFIAPEFYGSIKRLRDNTTPISYKGSTTVGALPKPYGFDGTVAAFQGTIGATAQTFIYATMRRGGRVVYAFDVTAPASPVLKWKKGCPNNFPASGTVDDTDCTTGFTGMAQSWSAPKILKAEGYGSAPDTTRAPLLMMGGGYDTCEDYDAGTAGGANHNCSSTKGNRIYLMDADTGVLQQTFNTDRAVVGDVTIIPDSTTGLIKYAYASDMGGNVYRISGATANSPIGTTAPGSWTMTKIASLGCDTTATCTAPRKFTYGPDVVEESGTYYLLLGSGDREKPLTAYVSAKAVANNFFMIKDKPTEATWLSSESSNCEGNSVICRASLTAITDNTTPVQATLDASKGWYLGLAASEQVVTSAITIFGKVTFSTHQPAVPVVGACGSNLGTSRVYNIGYLNAGSLNGTSNRYQDLAGDGLPPSPVAGLVTLDDGTTVPFVIGANPDSPLETTLPGGGGGAAAATTPKSRVYWYIQQ